MIGTSAEPPYRRAELPVEVRLRDLLGRMTLDEKLAQLGAVWGASLLEGDRLDEGRAKTSLAHGIGQITRLAGASTHEPDTCARLANEIQRFLRERTRLGVPALLHEESCAGFSARGATCFPQIIGLASTWEPPLVEAMARVIREQMRAVGARLSLAPVLDLARDPRWGRCEETFGEDPYLVGRMGVSYVRGLQGADLSEGVAATGKHFVGYGAPEGGLNWAPARVPRRELLERFAVPFAEAIREAGLACVMNGYHEIDGVPCGASRELLEEILRGTLGFDGVVLSDYFTLQTFVSYHAIAADESEAACRALEAGVDVELPALVGYGEPLRRAIADGRIDERLVDRSAARVLRLKLELGLFEAPPLDESATGPRFDDPSQRALARRIAAKSIVLLENHDELLPLAPNLRRVAVIGPSADCIRLLQGDYHYPTHLEVLRGEEEDLEPLFVPMVSLLEGIRAAVSPETEVHHVHGCELLGGSTEGFGEATELARRCDVAIVVVGGRSGLVEGCTSGEFCDRAGLELPGVQTELALAVHATGTATVVVLLNGRPLVLTRLAECIPAIVEAWLPGEEGGHAVADVLFGRVNPAGRLPLTLPRAVGQLPLYYDHKPSGARSPIHGDYADLSTRPLYPFGHGLSYTRFSYGGLKVTPRALPMDEPLRVELELGNTGCRAGEEVVQLYLRDRVASVTRPVQQLAGFVRLALEPGEVRRVVFHVDPARLAFYDEGMEPVLEPGTIEVMVGSSCADIRLRSEIELVGERRAARPDRAEPTRVELE
ncbi:MAG: glycoside hydrolase family 3 N-terminal domain-containing protein [Myxococcota bacterium]